MMAALRAAAPPGTEFREFVGSKLSLEVTAARPLFPAPSPLPTVL